MTEPSATSSRQAIAAGVAAAIVFAGMGFMLGRNTAEPPATTPGIELEEAPEPTPELLPVQTRPLSRADLLNLANAAADAVSSVTTSPQSVADAAGRRFSLYLPFGCAGPATEHSTHAMSWRIDDDAGLLKLRIAPKGWDTAEWWTVSPPTDIVSITGFWITRPWSSAEVCPPVRSVMAPGTLPLVLPGQTLAIGQSFHKDRPRPILRESKALEADIRLPADFTPPANGFRLRLTGRLERPRTEPAIRCVQPAGAEQRPICLILASFEELIVENTDTGETLTRWALND